MKTNNYNTKSTKKTPVSLTQSYDAQNASIGTIVAELCVIDRNIATIFCSKLSKTCKTVEEYLNEEAAIIDEDKVYIKDLIFDDLAIIVGAYMSNYCTPQLIGKHNIHSAWSVSSNRIYVKTENSFAINIAAKYHIDEIFKTAIIDTYDLHVITYNEDQRFIATAKKLGYTVTDNAPYQGKTKKVD